MKNKYLIISPHLDDAVLSCGASMAQWKEEGAEVLVASIFSSCAEYNEKMNAVYQNRRKQDIEALSFLGVKAIHLDFTDAPFRNGNYHSFSTILFNHNAEDKELEKSIALAISKLLHEIKPNQVCFPLGVGGHIDHHLVHKSSYHTDFEALKIQFYEELPYALVPGWTEIRLQKLGYAYELYPLLNLPSSLLDIKLPFVHNYTMDEIDKKASNLLYLEELNSLKTEKVITSKLTREKSYFDKHFFKKKCEAILYYQTEWPSLFGDAKNIKTILNPDSGEAYSESFWKKN
ncbi:PIG-L family deacetylase [Marivirga lumbricoides]